jgi:hypothetical protein
MPCQNRSSSYAVLFLLFHFLILQLLSVGIKAVSGHFSFCPHFKRKKIEQFACNACYLKMNYQDYKTTVLAFFDDYILRYVISDLKKLDSIQADAQGAAGCTVPQALATFAAVDLFGYLIDPNNSNTIKMTMMPFLGNSQIFAVTGPSQLTTFMHSFRDDVRSATAHRYFFPQFDVTKDPQNSLFINSGGVTIFNVSYFTTVVINGITTIHRQIIDDRFIISGYTQQESVQRFYDRLQALKNYTSAHYSAASIAPLTTSSTTQLRSTESYARGVQ